MKNLISKIKLIWKGREIASNLIQIKSKWKSIPFWVAIIGNVLAFLGATQGFLPPQLIIILNASLTAIYNYLRGLEKAETDGVKPFKTSSEFILSLLTTANNAIIDMETGGVSTYYLGATSIALTHAVAAGRDLANMRPKEVDQAGVK